VSEASEIKRDGMTPVKNSGRSRGVSKGDAILEPFLVDIKEYDKSFSVSRASWAKIQTDAITNGRRQPALKLVLGGDLRVWVVSDHMFHQMREAWREKSAKEAGDYYNDEYT
jgi:hypothetical protein